MEILIMIAFPFTVLFMSFLWGLITRTKERTWYKTLIKSNLNPPSWVIAPVWTLLYIMIGISGFLIWNENQSFSKTSAWAIYFTQITLNFAWPTLFFQCNLLFISLIEILVLALSILVNIIIFYEINRIAGILLIPYMIWVSFASYLTYELWRLNRNRVNVHRKSLVN